MSHVVTLDIVVDSLSTLKAACERLGLEFCEGQTTMRYYGRWLNDYHGQDAAYRLIDPKTFGQCNHAIKVPGAAYDIGLRPHPKHPGKWMLYYDMYQQGRGIEGVCGPGLGLLKQRYAAERSKSVMRRAGWMVSEKKQNDGQLRLVCTK